jgi:hypothetical protein
VAVTNIGTGTAIYDWRTFFASRDKALSSLKNNLISSDNLRFHCIVTIFIRVAILIAWYAVVVMAIDICLGGGQLLFMGSEEVRFMGGNSENYQFSFNDYLSQTFSLFLSVSSLSVLTSSAYGIAILVGQVMIYFSVFVVVIGRFMDYVSMYTRQMETIAHNATAKKFNMPPQNLLVAHKENDILLKKIRELSEQSNTSLENLTVITNRNDRSLEELTNVHANLEKLTDISMQNTISLVNLQTTTASLQTATENLQTSANICNSDLSSLSTTSSGSLNQLSETTTESKTLLEGCAEKLDELLSRV